MFCSCAEQQIQVRDSDISPSDGGEIVVHLDQPSSTTVLSSEGKMVKETSPSSAPEIVKPSEDSVEYIPIGVLNIRDVNTTRSIEADVARLEAAKWIRTESIKHVAYPERSALRVFVLPDDVCRGIIPRENNSLRKSLRVIISHLDASSESWEGHFGREVSTATMSGQDEESLFYIFNTLESPTPDVSQVENPYSRRAMSAILSSRKGDTDKKVGSKGVNGLRTSLYSYQCRSAAYMIQRESQPGQTLDPRLQPFIGPTRQQYFYDKEDGSIVQQKRVYSEPCGGKFL